ncbi:MAG: pitrilysin family protein [Candidatus Nanoarchaeia archaeon]|nr:pitrilysin family protein [Candidatus Nanoarchaeia archaeon]
MEKINVNGIDLILDRVKGTSVAVFVRVKVGSNYENRDEAGICHLIEHMVFEGTKTKSAMELSNSIEKYGGEMNAFTDNEKTVYYVRIAKKHTGLAFETLSDMIKNSVFNEKSLEKEKKVVADEINMVWDDPKIYQWTVLLNKLFNKNPVKNPIYGRKGTVLKVNRKKIIDFYNKYYVKENTEVIVIGDFNKPEIVKLVKDNFNNLRKGKGSKREIINEKPLNNLITYSEKKKINQSYMVVGFRTMPRDDEESYVIDVINAILCKGQSSKLFDEIRTKRGLAYILGSYTDNGTDYGFLGIYIGTNKKNIPKIKEIIFTEINKLKKISDKDLKKAKDYQEGAYLLQMEEKDKRGMLISAWDLTNNLKDLENYVKKINKVSKEDVVRVVNKYLNEKNSAIITLEQI